MLATKLPIHSEIKAEMATLSRDRYSGSDGQQDNPMVSTSHKPLWPFDFITITFNCRTFLEGATNLPTMYIKEYISKQYSKNYTDVVKIFDLCPIKR